MRRALHVLLWTLGTLLLLYSVVLVIGGGLGKKPPLPAATSDAPQPLLFAHRGAVGENPENSQGSLAEAVRLGFPALEFDIQNSADGQFILFHDATAERMMGIPDRPSEMTVAELNDQSLLLNGQATGETVPTLEHVMDLYGDSLVFYFDMKRHGHDNVFSLANDIAAVIRDYHLEDRVIVASAVPWLIGAVEFSHPDIMTALEGIDEQSAWVLRWIPRRVKPDFLSTSYGRMTDEFVDWLNDSGWMERFITYHVPEEEFANVLDDGVVMVIADYGPYLDSLLGR